VGYVGHDHTDLGSTQTGTVTYRAAKGPAVCVKHADEPRVCGQFVDGTGGLQQMLDLSVGDQLNYRVVKRTVGGAQLVLIVTMA
jgi:hypothetical protein